MKKITFAIAALALMATTSTFAQIKVTARSKGLQKEMTCPSSRMTLLRDLDDNTVVLDWNASGDQDMRVFLGTPEDAKATISGLLDLLDGMDNGESATIECPAGRLSVFKNEAYILGKHQWFEVTPTEQPEARYSMHRKALARILKYLKIW